MIDIQNMNSKDPYLEFKKRYENALDCSQENIQSAVISSWNNNLNEVNSRIVNIKYIIDDEWVFFSNYNSPKSDEFTTHNQIAINFFWDRTNTQIRLKAYIKKTSEDLSDTHFLSRSKEKNALAISSNQSKAISSYDAIKDNYHKELSRNDNLLLRPKYWGGFSFTPYYFEFWRGHEFRLNKRIEYKLTQHKWLQSILQP
tara:strand:- start:489 stop:1088 length:600 start_codon:yes stop_codon:yes gene_type:complete